MEEAAIPIRNCSLLKKYKAKNDQIFILLSYSTALYSLSLCAGIS
jgi:hypothetical protein